ncbi:MAG: hypothetical protein LVQ95_05180 [Candidatus Micrarchaeales archaeon]|nr:hypothetical protein [Candidatus Micrarchaeales archaeon]
MRIGLILGFALALLALAGLTATLASAANSSQKIITGSVTVPCPFHLSIAPSSQVYVEPTAIQLDYSAYSLMNCTTYLAQGDVIVTNSISGYVYNSTRLSLVGIDTVPQNGVVTFPSNAQMSGTDNGIISLASSTDYNTSSVQFLVVTPASLVLSRFSASPDPASPGATMTFTSNIVNNGGLTASNVIVHIRITGPNSFSYMTTSPVLPLSPGQYETTTLILTGVSGATGAYTAIENASFNSSYVFNSVTYTSPNLYSNNATTQYSVAQKSPPPPPPSTGGAPGVIPPPPKSVGGIGLAQFPIYMNLFPGNVSIDYIGVTNNRSYSQWVNFSPIQQPSFDSIVLSSNSMLVAPFSTSYITMATTISRNAAPGSYLEMLNMTVSAPGQSTNALLFYKVDVQQVPTAPALKSTVVLLNGSRNALISYTAINPTNSTYTNLLVTAAIPALALGTGGTISQAGSIPSSILLNNTYYLEWEIPELSPYASQSSISAYIQNISRTGYIISPVTSFARAPPTPLTSIFRLLELNATPITVNGTSQIKLVALYTGSTPTNITFNLVPPKGIAVNRTFASLRVQPNQQFAEYFSAGPISAAGTRFLTLYVNVSQQTITYSIPVVAQLPQVQTGSVQIGIDLVHNEYRAIAIGVVSFLIIFSTAALVGRRISRSKSRGFHIRRRFGRLQMIKRRLREERPENKA